jgi:hypothetical protein
MSAIYNCTARVAGRLSQNILSQPDWLAGVAYPVISTVGTLIFLYGCQRAANWLKIESHEAAPEQFNEIVEDLQWPDDPVNTNPESRGLTLLRQHNLATPENCEKLREIEILDDRFFLSDTRRKVGVALGALNVAGLLNEENLTRFFGLNDWERQKLCRAFSVLQPNEQPQQGTLLDQRILNAMFEHPEQEWGVFLAELQSQGILNRDILNTLIDPENVANAWPIASGFLKLHEIRINGSPLEGPILEHYRAAVVQAGEHAKRLGEGLRLVHDLGRDQDVFDMHGLRSVRVYPEVRESILEMCKIALLEDPENAEIIARGFSRLIAGGPSEAHGLGMLSSYCQQVIRAREHAETLAKGLVELHNRKLSAQSWAIFYAHPQYAEDVAIGLSTLLLFSALREDERCIYALLAGETRGEHVHRILRELDKVGYHATLEQFNEIAGKMPHHRHRKWV